MPLDPAGPHARWPSVWTSPYDTLLGWARRGEIPGHPRRPGPPHLQPLTAQVPDLDPRDLGGSPREGEGHAHDALQPRLAV